MSTALKAVCPATIVGSVYVGNALASA